MSIVFLSRSALQFRGVSSVSDFHTAAFSNLTGCFEMAVQRSVPESETDREDRQRQTCGACTLLKRCSRAGWLWVRLDRVCSKRTTQTARWVRNMHMQIIFHPPTHQSILHSRVYGKHSVEVKPSKLHLWINLFLFLFFLDALIGFS